MRFTGDSGITYETDDSPLGRGGEGSIYAVDAIRRAGSFTASRPGPGDVRLVVKEFAPGRADATRQAKLSAMVARRPPKAAQAQLAWPLDVVTRNGAFAGFVMPRVGSARNLNEFYVAGPDGIGGPSGPSATYERQLTLAYNLCVAVAAVHDLGQVVGDLNPANGLVDGTTWNVTLIDCDSFHITDVDGHVFRCAVGMADYLAPEVHAALAAGGPGASLETISPSPYSRETDLFSLATLVFALLMNGCHPFACAVDPRRVPGLRCPQPVDNIRSGFTPFFQHKRGLIAPPYAPSASSLAPELRALFRQAFVRGHGRPDARPSARAWAQALRGVLDRLETCPSCGFQRAAACSCPRCDVRAGMARAAGVATRVTTHETTSPAARPPARGCARIALLGAIGVSCFALSVLGAPADLAVSRIAQAASDWRAWTTLVACVTLLLACVPAPRGDGGDVRRFLKGGVKALVGSTLAATAVLAIDLLAATSVPGYVALAAGVPALELVQVPVVLALGIGLPALAAFSLVYGLVGAVLLRGRKATGPK